MLRRLAACSILAVAVATATYGAAASLGVTADNVSAGSADPTVDCAISSNDVVYSYTGTNVSSVQVSNLPVACRDGRVWLTLLNGSNGVVAQVGPVPANGASATFTSLSVPATDVKKYTIAVVK